MSKGDLYRPVDKEKYDINYAKIYGMCRNRNCPKRLTCLRWLETPTFTALYIDDMCKNFGWYKETK